nr:FHA domain-containing protein [Nakamurella endophytica]
MSDSDFADRRGPAPWGGTAGAGQSGDTTTVFPAGLFPTAETEAVDVQRAPEGGLDALSSDSALLVVKRGPNAGSRFPLDKDVVSAGRHPQSDIFLDDVTVSRRHAEFRRTGNGFEVSDVGSLNGTYVNREPIETSALTNGDEVQIGKFRLVFLTGSQPEGARSS